MVTALTDAVTSGSADMTSIMIVAAPLAFGVAVFFMSLRGTIKVFNRGVGK